MTPRAVVVGLLLGVFLCIVTPYTDLIMRTSMIACDHLPIGVLTLFLLLVALANPVLRRLPLVRPFSSAELITIYAMMLVVAGIPSFGLAAYLFPIVTARYYYSPADSGGGSALIHQFVPRWFAPRDDLAIKSFYEGLRPGEAIPWHAWVTPLVGWGIFVLALYLVIACMATLLRKQWVERERLAFPLVQLPLEMVAEEGAPGGNSFFRNRYVWIGILIPVAFHGMNGLHTYISSIPEIQLKWIDLSSGIVSAPWYAIRPLYVFVYFSVIGFAFLLSSDVGLGLVVFYFFYKLQAVAISAFSYEDPSMYGYLGPGYVSHQGAGALIAIVVSSLWMARSHLAEIWRSAMGQGTKGADAGEPMSYSGAFWGLVVGTLVLVAWCVAAGMHPLVALILILLFYVMMVGLAKFVADSGLLFVQSPFQPGDLMTTTVGTAPLGPANLFPLAMVQFIFMFDMRCFLMPSLMDGYKMADSPPLKRRSLFKAMALAICVGVVVSYISVLAWTYHTGGMSMNSWFFHDANRVPYMQAIDRANNAVSANWRNLAFTAIGAIVAAAAIFMRQHFVWWPLHPIGYAMGGTFAMSQLWFSIFVGWLLKSFILRYGGRRLYVRVRPLFLGLILGEFGIAGLWVLVDLIFGIRGHAIFPN